MESRYSESALLDRPLEFITDRDALVPYRLKRKREDRTDDTLTDQDQVRLREHFNQPYHSNHCDASVVQYDDVNSPTDLRQTWETVVQAPLQAGKDVTITFDTRSSHVRDVAEMWDRWYQLCLYDDVRHATESDTPFLLRCGRLFFEFPQDLWFEQVHDLTTDLMDGIQQGYDAQFVREDGLDRNWHRLNQIVQETFMIILPFCNASWLTVTEDGPVEHQSLGFLPHRMKGAMGWYQFDLLWQHVMDYFRRMDGDYPETTWSLQTLQHPNTSLCLESEGFTARGYLDMMQECRELIHALKPVLEDHAGSVMVQRYHDLLDRLMLVAETSSHIKVEQVDRLYFSSDSS